jgi:PKD repeat protein
MDDAPVGGLSGYVWIVDDNGSVRSGNVHARWTYPNGATADQVRHIGGVRARAQFDVGLPNPLPGGTYTLTVLDVISDSCTFDPAMSNVLEHSVTLPGSINPNPSPVAVADADIRTGDTPLVVNFNSTDSYDPNGTIVAYEWNFKDGSPISTDPNPVHTFNTPGSYNVDLKVIDDEGSQNVDTLAIQVLKASTTGCNVNCLQINTIKMSPKRSSIRAKVQVTDELGENVSGAVVSATWTFPGGNSITQSRRTNRRGRVNFTARKGDTGTYMLDITEVTRGGFAFDPDNSVLNDSITVR